MNARPLPPGHVRAHTGNTPAEHMPPPDTGQASAFPRPGIAPAQSGDVLDGLWWKAEPAPCGCGHEQRHHVAGTGHCPVVVTFDPTTVCDCPKYAAAAAGQPGTGGEADEPLPAVHYEASTEPREGLFGAARGWIFRHSSQPDGDRWRDDPKHLDWAAENLLCDLEPWLIKDSDPEPAPSAGQDTDDRRCGRCGQIPYVHGLPDSTCVYEPTEAGQDTERLRDERSVERHIAAVITKRIPDIEIGDLIVLRADLLDGPLRQLIAERDTDRASLAVFLRKLTDERDEARAKVQRVARVATELEQPVDGLTGPEGPMVPIYNGRDVAFRIRRVLDGET